MKKPLTKMPPPTEDETQKVIVDGLRALGYIVKITTRRPKKCWKCGAWPASGKGDGVTKSVPDLYVRRQTWPPGVAGGLEVKRPGKIRFSSLEQEYAARNGETLIVQSLEDALDALKAVEEVLA